MEFSNVKKVLVSGDTEVTVPSDFVCLDEETTKTVTTSPWAHSRAIATGIMGDDLVVLTGEIDAWSWPMSNINVSEQLQRPIAVPLLDGLMVMVVDDNSNYVVVPTVDVIAQSTHALNNSELQLPTYNHAEDDPG